SCVRERRLQAVDLHVKLFTQRMRCRDRMRAARRAADASDIVDQRLRATREPATLQFAEVVVEALRGIVAAGEHDGIQAIELTRDPLLRDRTNRWWKGLLEVAIRVRSRRFRPACYEDR